MTRASLLLITLNKMVDMVDFGRVDASWGVFEGT